MKYWRFIMRRFRKNQYKIICNNCTITIVEGGDESKVSIIRNIDKHVQHFCSIDCLSEFIRIENNLNKKSIKK